MDITPDLLKNIKALAENPGATEGERQAAASKLKLLLEKSGIDPDSLDSEEQRMHFIPEKIRLRKEEVKLCVQVLAMVQDQHSVRFGFRNPKKRSGIWIKSTEYQAVRFSILFPHYLKAYRKSLETYVIAFIQAQNIFSNAPREKETVPDLDEETLMQIIRMMSGIKVVPPPAPRLKRGSNA